MKSYTLEWWLEMYERADTMERNCLRHFHHYDTEGQTQNRLNAMNRGLYLKELMSWIRKRIINKYGEND